MASDNQHQLYQTFVSWSASIGCPQPDPDLFRRLARGNGAHFLRLLVEYVHPADTVSHVRNVLRLHGVSTNESQKKQIHDQEHPERRHQDKLAFVRRSHAAAIQEIDYLRQKQSQMERSIREMSTSAVLLENAHNKNRRDHLDPIRSITESIRNIHEHDDQVCSDNSSSSRRLMMMVSMDDSGRLETADPVRSALHALYTVLVDDHTRIATESLRFAPNASIVDDLSRITQQRQALLAKHRNDAGSRGGGCDDDAVSVGKPISLGQLMQDSRNTHIERFFDALDKLNLAGDIQSRRGEPAAGPESALRQAGLRARLDCLNRHIQRCEQELARAQADYDDLHGSLDAISKLESERERLHRRLATIVKANRELRSSLAQRQAQCHRDQATLDSAIRTMSDRIARLSRCFEIAAGALLRRSSRPDSDSETACWRATGRCLGIHESQVCDPVSILIAIRSRFERLCSLRLSSHVAEPLLASAMQIESGDIEGLRDRCKQLHSNSEQVMLDLHAMLKTLESLDKDCASYRDLMKEWWEQPAQFTVPDEQRFGLSINGWIERRRRLVTEFRREQGGL